MSSTSEKRKFSLVVRKSSEHSVENKSVRKQKAHENGHSNLDENLRPKFQAQTRIEATYKPSSRNDIGDQMIIRSNEMLRNTLICLKSNIMVDATQERSCGSCDFGDWCEHQNMAEQQREEILKNIATKHPNILYTTIRKYEAEQMVEQPSDRRYSQHEISKYISERETARETILAELEEKMSIDAIRKHEAAREELLAAWHTDRLEEGMQKHEIERELISFQHSNTVFHQHELEKEKALEKREFHQLHKDAILKLEAQREAVFDQQNENDLSNAVCRYENTREMLLSEMEEKGFHDAVISSEGNTPANENNGSI